jgi:hypothetical protein
MRESTNQEGNNLAESTRQKPLRPNSVPIFVVKLTKLERYWGNAAIPTSR